MTYTIQQEDTIDNVIDSLKNISPRDYNDWIYVGLAIHNWNSKEGFDIFVEWSATTPESYSLETCTSKWEAFGQANDNPTTVVTKVGNHLKIVYSHPVYGKAQSNVQYLQISEIHHISSYTEAGSEEEKCFIIVHGQGSAYTVYESASKVINTMMGG